MFLKALLKENNKKKLGVVIFVVALLIAGAMLPSRFALTLTPSVPYRLFFIGGKPELPVSGSYVLFEKDLSEIGGGHQEKIIKKVACIEGSVLQAFERNYYCDGEWLGRAKEQTLEGKKTVPFIYDGKIPRGKMFVMGTHVDSYDSRYFGFIDRKEAKSIVYPIL